MGETIVAKPFVLVLCYGQAQDSSAGEKGRKVGLGNTAKEPRSETEEGENHRRARLPPKLISRATWPHSNIAMVRN